MTSTVLAWTASGVAQPTGKGTAGDAGTQPTTAGVELTTISGTATGSLRALAFPANGSENAVALGSQVTNLDEVLGLSFDNDEAKVDSRRLILLLRSGEEVLVEPLGGNEDEITFRVRAAAAAGATAPRLSLPISAVRALLLPGNFPSATEVVSFRRSLPGRLRAPIVPVSATAVGGDRGAGAGADEPSGLETVADDILVTAEGSRLTGVLASVGSTSVTFDASGVGEVKLPFDQIRAVKLADLGGEDEPPERTSGLTALLTAVDGSMLIGELAAIADGTVELRSRSLDAVKIPLTNVRQIEIQGGRCRYLSDLDPIRASSKDFFSSRPVQRDASVRGGPLEIRDRRFRKGLGMRSHTRLEYDLGGLYERFQALIGIDDEARTTSAHSRRTGGGTAVFRVYVDGELAIEKELSYRDPPHPIDVPVAGKKTLALEVDYGPGLWMLDFANWADAKLLRVSDAR